MWTLNFGCLDVVGKLTGRGFNVQGLELELVEHVRFRSKFGGVGFGNVLGRGGKVLHRLRYRVYVYCL